MTTLRFDGKVGLITGVGPGGLGHAYAKLLASRGATLVINDLGVDWRGNSTSPGADAVVAELRDAGAEAIAVHGDVAHDAERIVAAAVERYQHLDFLVNNAGAGGDFDTTVGVHLGGSYRMTAAAWPWLEKSGHGRVVNIASNATWGSDGSPAYGAAKSGVIALTRVQARNGLKPGIGVNVVLPSAWANSLAGLPDPAVRDFLEARFAAAHVAGFVAYLCHESASQTGLAFSVGGGVVARVVQAKSPGYVDPSGDPDVWAAHIDEVTDLTGLIVPPSMWGDVRLLAEAIGPEAVAEFDALDFSMLGGL